MCCLLRHAFVYLVILPFVLGFLSVVGILHAKVVADGFDPFARLVLFFAAARVGTGSNFGGVPSVTLYDVRIHCGRVLDCGRERGMLKEAVLDGVYLREGLVLWSHEATFDAAEGRYDVPS